MRNGATNAQLPTLTLSAGDGTQEIFYDDPTVLTISCHVAARVRNPRLIDDRSIPSVATVVWPMSIEKGVACKRV